jgi:hypothetical protein
MEMSGQLHAPRALTIENKPRIIWPGSRMSSRVGLRILAKKQKFFKLIITMTKLTPWYRKVPTFAQKKIYNNMTISFIVEVMI